MNVRSSCCLAPSSGVQTSCTGFRRRRGAQQPRHRSFSSSFEVTEHPGSMIRRHSAPKRRTKDPWGSTAVSILETLRGMPRRTSNTGQQLFDRMNLRHHQKTPKSGLDARSSVIVFFDLSSTRKNYSVAASPPSAVDGNRHQAPSSLSVLAVNFAARFAATIRVPVNSTVKI